MGLLSFIDDFISNPLADDSIPRAKKYSKVAEKVKGKISTRYFNKDEDTKYSGGGARDIPWKSKNPDLMMKAIQSRIMDIRNDLREHGFTRDANDLDQIWDWLYDYEKVVLSKMSEKEQEKYYQISGYYADYDLSDY